MTFPPSNPEADAYRAQVLREVTEKLTEIYGRTCHVCIASFPITPTGEMDGLDVVTSFGHDPEGLAFLGQQLTHIGKNMDDPEMVSSEEIPFRSEGLN